MDKIRITTHRYAYMGLAYDTIIEIACKLKGEYKNDVCFNHNGKQWTLSEGQGDFEYVEEENEIKFSSGASVSYKQSDDPIVSASGRTFDGIEGVMGVEPTDDPTIPKISPVKSDGGSSSYYEKKIVRLKDGQVFNCQTGDIIRSMVDNDFDGGNILKALDRIFQNVQGKGKEGVTIEYDCNKIIYFANVIKQRFKNE